MARLNAIIQNIKNLKAGGIQNRDIELSDRQYAFIISYYRSLLLRREIEQGRKAKGNWIQNLGQVSFVKADMNDCCDIEDCIIRTELQIPSPIEVYDTDLITYVGTTDHRMPFQRTTTMSFWRSFTICCIFFMKPKSPFRIISFSNISLTCSIIYYGIYFPLVLFIFPI